MPEGNPPLQRDKQGICHGARDGGDHHGWDDYDVIDLFGGGRYRWRGADNVVILTPDAPVHVFQLQQVSR